MYVDPNEQGRYQVWQNVNAPGYFPTGTKQNVIMVTAIDKFARRNEMLSDEQIKKEVYAILQEMYGQNIPPIRDIAVPRWTIDPLYRGSYSNWPLGAVDEHHLNLGKPVGAMKSWIHFTGEALSAEAFGYVQGAWDEAHKTANTIAQCLSSKCPMVEIYESIKVCPQKPTQQFKRNARRVSFTN
jgi:polyamine oxidase